MQALQDKKPRVRTQGLSEEAAQRYYGLRLKGEQACKRLEAVLARRKQPK